MAHIIKGIIMGLFLLPGFVVGWLARATREGFDSGYWSFGQSLDRHIKDENRKRGES